MRYLRKAMEPAVVGKTKSSLLIHDGQTGDIEPFEASFRTVQQMMIASKMRRNIEMQIQNSQNGLKGFENN